MKAVVLAKARADNADEGPSVRAVQISALGTCLFLAIGKAGGPTRAFSGRRLAPCEIGAILTSRNGSNAFPVYEGAAAEAQTVGPP